MLLVVTLVQTSALPVSALLSRLGDVFATFDARTQDSGHISHGIQGVDGRRWFVKTAGDARDSPGGTTYQERLEALRRAAGIQREVDHPAFVPLDSVVQAADGVLVVYEWFEGELLRSPARRRDDPLEAHSRFRALPLPHILDALDSVIDVHVLLERAGWIAGDFYDGCLMYDFRTHRIKLIDLEAYRRGPSVNEVGRLPGSTRFMAPEEWTIGALINARTTVFNLGRMLEIFLVPRDPDPRVKAVAASATAVLPDERPSSVADLQREWRSAAGR